jgi:hypothetical protein
MRLLSAVPRPIRRAVVAAAALTGFWAAAGAPVYFG